MPDERPQPPPHEDRPGPEPPPPPPLRPRYASPMVDVPYSPIIEPEDDEEEPEDG
jgi:hypothetical protein